MNESIPDMNLYTAFMVKDLSYRLSSILLQMPFADSSDFVAAITALLFFCQLDQYRSTFKVTHLPSQYYRSRIELPLLTVNTKVSEESFSITQEGRQIHNL
ncbi:hypothetical protein [Brevibacillus brevis]|uniref:hypothetical protein n=1 Tax=Brevibacillus brevis TaxID=1393 RepID=UPI0018FF8CCE|nr:hypothetical protein [Brevibacillus brevis]